MTQFLLTVITVIFTSFFVTLTMQRTLFGLDEAYNGLGYGMRIGEKVALTMSFFGLALCCFLQTAPFEVVQSYTIGGRWSNPFFHIPTARDFWTDFIPSHLGGRGQAYELNSSAATWLDIIAAVSAAVGSLLLFRIFRGKAAHGHLRAAGVLPAILWSICHLLMYFIAFEIVVFLLARIIAFLMFFGANLWILLVLLLMGAAGGGKVAVYNKHGRKIGEVDRDAF